MSSIDDFGIEVPQNNLLKQLKDEPCKAAEAPCDPRHPLASAGALTQWTEINADNWIPVGKTISKLNAGAYKINGFLQNGTPILSQQDINVDSFLKFSGSIADGVMKEIADFWSRENLFKKYGFLHRRGYLFYGPAGSGKTILTQQIISDIIHRGDIVLLCGDPRDLSLGLTFIRKVEKTRKIVCVFEDIDAIVNRWSEDTLLSILDGEAQIDHVLNIATTNYPERLDKRIVGRPRRFDRIVKIGMPPAPIRYEYFQKKLQIEESEINRWVEATEGFSFAALAEMVISIKCLGNSFEDTIRILEGIAKRNPSSDEFKEKLGFNGNGAKR